MSLPTCKHCDVPVSLQTALLHGLCRSHAQQERKARAQRHLEGRPTQQDLWIKELQKQRKSAGYVQFRNCEFCGKQVRSTRSLIARCRDCYMNQRFPVRNEPTLSIAIRLPVSKVDWLRQHAQEASLKLSPYISKVLTTYLDSKD